MKRKAYESDPVPSQLTHDQYRYGTRDYIMKRTYYVDELGKARRIMDTDTLDIKSFLNFVSSDDPRTKFRRILELQGEDVEYYPSQLTNSNYFPVEYVTVPVSKENVLKNGIVSPKDTDQIVPELVIRIKESALYKNRLLMLDIVANNNWERPIYFSGGAFGDDDYIWMKDYLQLDGMCYKLVPIRTPVDRANPFDMGRVDSDKMYSIVKKWDWGNSGDPDLYHDPETRKNSITYRGNLARLIEQFINEDKLDKAEEIADLAMTNMPVEYYNYYTLLEPYISAYYEVDAKDKARKLFKDVSKKYQENLSYYGNLDETDQYELVEEILTDIERYKAILDVVNQYDDDEFANQESDIFSDYLSLFDSFGGGQEEPESEELIPDMDIETLNNSDSVIVPAEED